MRSVDLIGLLKRSVVGAASRAGTVASIGTVLFVGTVSLVGNPFIVGGASAAEKLNVSLAKGEVIAVDERANTLVVRPAAGQGGRVDLELRVSPETKIIKADHVIEFGQLKTSDRVVVNYHVVDGANVAVSIGVQSPAA